jgi:hypothetical protein
MMKLTKIARGHIVLEDGDKTAIVYGEAFIRGHGSPDFIVYCNTILQWDFPNDDCEISSQEKSEIIKFLRNEFIRRNMIVEIE